MPPASLTARDTHLAAICGSSARASLKGRPAVFIDRTIAVLLALGKELDETPFEFGEVLDRTLAVDLVELAIANLTGLHDEVVGNEVVDMLVDRPAVDAGEVGDVRRVEVLVCFGNQRDEDLRFRMITQHVRQHGVVGIGFHCSIQQYTRTCIKSVGVVDTQHVLNPKGCGLQ